MQFTRPFYCDAYYRPRRDEYQMRLKNGELPSLLYLVTLKCSDMVQDLMELYPAVFLRETWFVTEDIVIAGFAHSKSEGQKLIAEIAGNVVAKGLPFTRTGLQSYFEIEDDSLISGE